MEDYNELDVLMVLYEDQHLTESQIMDRCIELATKHNFDRDFLFDLNDVIFNHGYSFQFKVPKLERADFDSKIYGELTSNTGKSETKTKDLIKYLNSVKSHILTLASLNFLKTKYLVSLGLLQTDDEYIKNNINLSFRDLLFKAFDEDVPSKNLLIQTLEKLGMPYPALEYSLFRLDCEYLIWTISKNDKTYGYIKENTLKVAFNITPKEFFEREDKKYYNEKFSKVAKNYLKLIGKSAISKIKCRWGENAYPTDKTGYSLFYEIL